jgi:hypothetical protein
MKHLILTFAKMVPPIVPADLERCLVTSICSVSAQDMWRSDSIPAAMNAERFIVAKK